MYQPHDRVKICMLRDQIKGYTETADEEDKAYWEMMFAVISLILSDNKKDRTASLSVSRRGLKEDEVAEEIITG